MNCEFRIPAGPGSAIRCGIFLGVGDPKITKQDVAAQFGRRSHAYVTSPSHAGGADLGLLLQLVAPHPQMQLLDVATGAGHTAMALAPYVAAVTAIDLAPEMICRTQELCASRGLRNITAMVMDVEALEFPEAVFDAVTCRIAAHHFLDCVKSVREMARVLKPGGRLVLEDNSVPADPELDRFLNGVERIRDATHVRAYNEAEWRAMLAGAGLRVLHSQIHRKVLNIPDWLERAGLDEAGKQRVYAAMAAASPAARRHFEIVEEAGRPAFFSDDKLILLAEKPSA